MSSESTAVTALAAVARSIIYLGLDVHKDSITTAVLPKGAATPTRVERLPNDLPRLKRFLDRLAREGELRACYETSGAGYVLQRLMCEMVKRVFVAGEHGLESLMAKRFDVAAA